MRLTRKCQYALRAVLELAARNTGQPVKVQDIASAQNISPRFLEVILNELRHGGFVNSRRGSEGGYILVRPADELTVGQVIEYIQGPIATGAQKTGRTGANASYFGEYVFEELWKRVNGAISQICEATTFGELVEQERARRSVCAPNYAI